MTAKLNVLPPQRPSAVLDHLVASQHSSGDRRALSIALGIAIAAHGLLFLIPLPRPTAAPSPPPRPDAPRITRTILRPPPIERPKVERTVPARRLPLPGAERDDFAPVPEPREHVSPTGPALNLDLPFNAIARDAPQPALATGPRVVGGDVLSPQLVEDSKVTPAYPELARVARREGSVILQAVILPDGSVGEIQVLRVSPPNFGFEEAAIEAVRRWQYLPATVDGRPVAVYFTVQVRFDLN